MNALVCAYVFAYESLHVCMKEYVYVNIYVAQGGVHVCVHTCLCISLCMCVCRSPCIRKHIWSTGRGA